MTRVLYIGNFGPEHSTENHVQRAFASQGHDVIMKQEGTSWLNTREAVQDADFVLWTHTHGLAPESTHGEQAGMLLRLARWGVPTVAFHLDRWWGLDREHQIRDHPYFHCDLVITADGGHQEEFAKLGINHVWMPPAVSEFECLRTPALNVAEYRAPITFVGSWQGGYHAEWKHREELVRYLRRRGANFWPKKGEPAIRGQALRDLYANTSVVVGDSCLVGNATRYWSDRIPETLGRGGFLLHPWVEGLDEHFTDGEHLVTWKVGDWGDLTAKLNHYERDGAERARISENGRAHVLEFHTYEVRCRAIVELVAAL